MATIEIEEPQPARRVIAHTALRMATGAAVLVHVGSRLQHQALLQQHLAAIGLPHPELLAWLVLGGEVAAGVALVLGLFTRAAAFGVMTGLLCWLALMLRQGVVPTELLQNTDRLELRLLLLGSSLFFVALGAGSFSLDSFLRHRARMRAIARDPIWQSPPYAAPPARTTR